MYECIYKQDFSRWEWAEELLLTRYSRSYSQLLMIISMTELQFNKLFFMKRLNFVTYWRCLVGPGNIFQNSLHYKRTSRIPWRNVLLGG